MAISYVIAGLGNPGPRYAMTRHNIGFMVVDYLAERLDAGFKAGRGDYFYAAVQSGQHKLYLVKPTTYMNLSGHGVRQAVDYWKVELDRLLVIYDDFNLPFGKIRLRATGSDGGHKGMRSLIQVFGTEDIARLRVGIGRDGENQDAADFVLSNFPRKELKELPALLEICSDAVDVFVKDGIEKAMNRFNSQTIV